MDEDRAGCRGAIGGELHDEGDILALEGRALQKPCRAYRHEYPDEVQGEEDEGGLPRDGEECPRQQDVHR